MVQTGCRWASQAVLVLAAVLALGKAASESQSVLTRHGDRTPVYLAPEGHDNASWHCDFEDTSVYTGSMDKQKRLFRKEYLPFREPLHGNCFMGQLTPTGLRQHQALGAQLRQRYVSTHAQPRLLPKTFDPDRVWIRSTDVPRTIQSAQGLIEGMYPVHEAGNSKHHTLRQWTMQEAYETMSANWPACPAVGVLEREFFNSKEYAQRQEYLAPLIAKLNKAGLGDIPWTHLYDLLWTRHSHGKPLLAGVSQDMFDQVSDQADWIMGAEFTGKAMQRVSMGAFIHDVIENMLQWIDGVSANFLLFSGHDSSVGPLLNLLGIYDGRWPNYAHNIVFELYVERADQIERYYVRVLYQLEPRILPRCGVEYCPLELFKESLADVSVTHAQWRALCHASLDSDVATDTADMPAAASTPRGFDFVEGTSAPPLSWIPHSGA